MIDQIFMAVQVAAVTNKLGPEWRELIDAPPCIVWEPNEGELKPGKSVTNYASNEPASIATCDLVTTVFLWAVWPVGTTPLPDGYDQSQADYQALWDLIRKFLVALRDAAPGGYELGQVRYLAKKADALIEFGKAAEVDVTWSIPVTRDARPTVAPPDPAHLTMEGTMDLNTDVTGTPAP